MMRHEQFSSSPPPIETAIYEEVFASEDAFYAIRRIELSIEKYANEVDEIDEDILRDKLEQLDELMRLADHQEDVPAKYTGFLYPYDDFGGIADEGVAVYDEDVRFAGSRCIEANDAQRVVFAMEWDNGDESKEYGAPLDAILQLEIARESLAMTLRRHGDTAAMTVGSNEFLQSSRHRQVAELQTLTQGCYEDVKWFTDEQQQIALSGEAYIRYDEMADTPFEVISYQSPSQYISGTLAGVGYVESRYNQKHTFRRFEEFMHGGVPCVILRSSDLQATVYMPISGVTAYHQSQ